MSEWLLSTYGITMADVCRWYSQLQQWEWPDDFPISKPVGWDTVITHREKSENKVFGLSKWALQLVIPTKEHLRRLKVGFPLWRKGTMSNDDFEKEWRDSYPLGDDAYCMWCGRAREVDGGIEKTPGIAATGMDNVEEVNKGSL